MCRQAVFLFGGSRKGSTSLLIWVTGRIQFLMIFRLMAPFLCWLRAQDCSQLVKASHILILILRLQNHQRQVGSLSCLSFFLLPFFATSLSPTEERISAFKGSLVGPTQLIQENLLPSRSIPITISAKSFCHVR